MTSAPTHTPEDGSKMLAEIWELLCSFNSHSVSRKTFVYYDNLEGGGVTGVVEERLQEYKEDSQDRGN